MACGERKPRLLSRRNALLTVRDVRQLRSYLPPKSVSPMTLAASSCIVGSTWE